MSLYSSSAAARNLEVFESNFDRLCAAADTCKARGEPPRYAEPSAWLRVSDAIPQNWDEMTIEGLMAHFDRVRRRDGAAVSTVEALVLSLRQHGVKALMESAVRRRLSELSDQQVITVGNRPLRLIARAWTAAEVQQLFKVRQAND